MELLLIGLNHRTAPLALRERLAFSDDEAAFALDALRREEALAEAVLFSTCNRVEVLAAAEDAAAAESAVLSVLCRVKGVRRADFEGALYRHAGDEACRHVFRVAASLDSLVVGEPQILGQVKKSYRAAVAAGASGVVVNRLLHRAFSTAKRVRKETGIGGHAVSVSYAAVELAKKIFGELSGKKVLLVGAGEMAELAVEHLMHNRAERLFVVNRTLARAVALASRFGGEAVAFEGIEAALKIVDIVISSTGASDFVIRRDQVKAVMRPRRNRPLFFIDIAVPRDIDPAVNNLENVYLYDVDDLAAVVEQNKAERAKEAARAEIIVEESVMAFRRWFDALDAVPTIKAIRERMEAVRAAEMEKSRGALKDLSPEEVEAVERLTRSILAKLLHGPTVFLKKGAHGRARKRDIIGAARDMFSLDEEEGNGNGE